MHHTALIINDMVAWTIQPITKPAHYQAEIVSSSDQTGLATSYNKNVTDWPIFCCI